MFFPISALITISTGDLVKTTGNKYIGDGLAVSIGATSIGDVLAVSIGYFAITCSSSSVVSTQKVQNWRIQLNQQWYFCGNKALPTF